MLRVVIAFGVHFGVELLHYLVDFGLVPPDFFHGLQCFPETIMFFLILVEIISLFFLSLRLTTIGIFSFLQVMQPLPLLLWHAFNILRHITGTIVIEIAVMRQDLRYQRAILVLGHILPFL